MSSTNDGRCSQSSLQHEERERTSSTRHSVPSFFASKMILRMSSAQLAILVAYSLLYFSKPVSTADVPDTSSNCASDGSEAYKPHQV